MDKKRLDILIFERKLSESRERASRLILTGRVEVNGKIESKSGMKFKNSSKIKILEKNKYVGRGGDKIESVYSKLKINFKNKVICDVGASTGGFTDFALKKGAKKIYAVDVGYGQLAQKIRENQKVVAMERTDIRNINIFPEKIDVFFVDVSFISLKKIFPKIKETIKKQKTSSVIISLIKPQFEVGKDTASKFKGVIKDSEIQKEVVSSISSFAQEQGFSLCGLYPSLVKGDKGNQEYFLCLRFE